LTEQVTKTIRKIAMQALQEASLKLVYEDEDGQAWIPKDEMYEMASKKTGLTIETLKWVNDNREIN
tara:strand:+ start:258 stop:455 length:198 start_codon:yes stop_codon:yes gene_type:complete